MVLVFVIAFSVIFFFSFKKAVAPTDISQKLTSKPNPSPPKFEGEDEILRNALNLYVKKKEEGVDFSNGPCLGMIAQDWVLDIAHNPRLLIDDKAQNQCADFREGRAHHFIELDEEGNLIRSF